MLKRFFNSPYFVGLLALAALGVIYVNVIQPMIGGAPTVESVTAPIASIATSVADEVAPSLSQANPFDRAAVGWVETPGRDPFLPGPAPQETATASGQEGPPRAADLFSLAGTMVDPGDRIASINGATIREGDRLNEYRVERIEAGVVWLNGPRGAESISVASPTATAVTPTR